MKDGAEPAGQAEAAPRAYHHGDLRHHLIATAEALLLERGVEGFSLRECARRAGVSPAAPAHHFGNMTGLLTAIATLGFGGLAEAMETAARQAGPQTPRLQALGLGYIRFALAFPARFRVMFGRFALDHADPPLAAAAQRAFGILEGAIAARPHAVPETTAQADLVTAWSLVHGFANLALDGRLPFVEGPDREAALDRMARAVTAIFR